MDHDGLPRAHTDGRKCIEDILLEYDLPIHCQPLSIPSTNLLLRHVSEWHTDYAAYLRCK